jgi:flagellar hook-associated protein 2
MAGINVSGFLNNSFDWQTMVDKLIEVDSTPIKRLQAEQTANTNEITALADIKTALADLQDAVQTLRDDALYSARTVLSDTSATTWRATSSTGAPVGSYKIAVSQLATASTLQGAGDIGTGLNATNDVSGLTLANLATATAVSAGTITVNGKQVTVALTDSLQSVFDAINDATGGTGGVGGDITASYDAGTDRVTLVSTNGPVVLGAANDTSNLLDVLRLANNGTVTVASAGALGTAKLASPLASAGLRTAITAVDAEGDGAFTINGVSIAYNVNTDSLSAVLTRLNNSTAGVTAAFDAVGDRVVLTNKTTGDTGVGASEAAGGLLGALGLTAGTTFTRGKNAEFTVNDGDTLTSRSNTLDATTHGITGLSVTVNTKTTQTLEVATDATGMRAAIEGFVEKFNAVQTLIEDSTATTVSGGTVTTSVLSDNREVDGWASRLRALAFEAVSGVSGSVTRLDDLGIDFDGLSGRLTVKDTTALANAVLDQPDDVADFFQTGTTGFVAKLYAYLTSIKATDTDQQERLNEANSDLDRQIADLQRRLDSEREQLTSAFQKMQEAQTLAQSQATYLTNAFFRNNSNN